MEKRGKCVKGEEGGKANAWASSLLFCPSHSCLCFGASLEIWGWWVSRVPEVRCLDGELGLVQVLEGNSVLQDQGFLPSCCSPNARRPGSREVCPCLSCNHLLHIAYKDLPQHGTGSQNHSVSRRDVSAREYKLFCGKPASSPWKTFEILIHLFTTHPRVNLLPLAEGCVLAAS